MRVSRRMVYVAFMMATGGLSGSFVAPAGQALAQAPDNSARNKGQTATADHQSNTPSDRALTAQVRRAVVSDKGLSTYAHNVKILVQNGTVTLKGPVRSDDERQKLLADAGSVVSSEKISDQLTVKQ
ncbi:MAG: BON domain-containing protein [Acidobacteriota bacterium]|nr:BON domain-containing protein [Acidobacteriota bacterium]